MTKLRAPYLLQQKIIAGYKEAKKWRIPLPMVMQWLKE